MYSYSLWIFGWIKLSECLYFLNVFCIVNVVWMIVICYVQSNSECSMVWYFLFYRIKWLEKKYIYILLSFMRRPSPHKFSIFLILICATVFASVWPTQNLIFIFINLPCFDPRISWRCCVPFASWHFRGFFVGLSVDLNPKFRRRFLLIRVCFWLTKNIVFLVVNLVFISPTSNHLTLDFCLKNDSCLKFTFF